MRKILKNIMAPALFFGLTALIIVGAASKFQLFRLEKIFYTESEAGEISQVIEQRLALYKKKKLFSFSLKDLEEEIKKISFVRKLNIQRRWPDTLVLDMMLRKPVALVFQRQNIVSVDDNCEVIETKKHLKPAPLLLNIENIPSQEFKKICEWLAYLQTQKTLQNLSLEAEQIDELEWNSEKGWLAKLYDSKLQIELGKQNFDRRWRRAQIVWEELKKYSLNVWNLDTTYEKRVVAKILQNSLNELNLKEILRRKNVMSAR